MHGGAHGHIDKVALRHKGRTQIHHVFCCQARVDHTAVHGEAGVPLHAGHVPLYQSPQPSRPGPALQGIRIGAVAVQHQHGIASIASRAEAHRGVAGRLEAGWCQHMSLKGAEQARPGYRHMAQGYHVHSTPGGSNKMSAVQVSPLGGTQGYKGKARSIQSHLRTADHRQLPGLGNLQLSLTPQTLCNSHGDCGGSHSSGAAGNIARLLTGKALSRNRDKACPKAKTHSVSQSSEPHPDTPGMEHIATASTSGPGAHPTGDESLIAAISEIAAAS